MKPMLAGCLAIALLAACPGCSDKPSSDDAAKAAPKPPEKPEKLAYVRPKLSDPACMEMLYYPLDTCVVSGKKFGPTAHDEEVAGRLVRTYNQHYIDAVKKDPEKYIALIDEAYRKRGAATYPLKTCVVTEEPLGDSPVELVLDMRQPYAAKLRYNERYMPYRYTVAGRLLRFKDEAALTAFKTVEANGRAPVAEKAMERYIAAAVAQQAPTYPTKQCAQNGRATGREGEDPETGGFRHYLLGDELFILCCKTCMDKMDKDFRVTVEAAAFLHGIKTNQKVNPENVTYLYRGRIEPPPQDAP